MINSKKNHSYLIEISETIELYKKWAQACLKMLSTKCVKKSYIFIYMYKKHLALNDLQCLMCHNN